MSESEDNIVRRCWTEGENCGLSENEKGESVGTPIQKEARMADPKWWDAFNTGGEVAV